MDEDTFQHIWLRIKPLIGRLILDEPITKPEWQDLFHDVHSICLWDERGCAKLLKVLEANYISLFIRNTKILINENFHDYVVYWRQFDGHCKRLPIAFQQLDLATKQPIVKTLLLKLWDKHIVSNFYQQLIDLAIDSSKAETEAIRRDHIDALRDSFTCLVLELDNKPAGATNINYLDHYHQRYLNDLELFLMVKNSYNANQSTRDSSCSVFTSSHQGLEYIDYAISEISKERIRARIYFGPISSALSEVIESCNRIFFSSPKTKSRFPELLASYCDQLLRQRSPTNRKLSSSEVDSRLREVVWVVKYTSDKETLLKCHKALLTRRLIQKNSGDFSGSGGADIEREETFIADVKQLESIPQDIILTLEKMFKDLRTSRALQQEYKLQNCENNNSNSQDTTNIRILTSTAWTKPGGCETNSGPMNLPNSIQSFRPSFEAFYTSQFPGRKLEWCDQLSNGTITFNSINGEYDLDVTAAQLSVLAAFGEHERDASYSLRELEQLTGMNGTRLVRTLWSLVSNPRLKSQLLKCEPQVNSVKELELVSSDGCSNNNNNHIRRYSINRDFALMKNDKPLSKGRACLIGRLQA